MARVPNRTHEYTDELGVKHYTKNTHRMFDMVSLLCSKKMAARQMPNKKEIQEIVAACHRIGMTYWTEDNIVRYIGAYIGRARGERLKMSRSLQKHVDNHRKMVGYEPAF
jgi:hypothetical protein